MSNLNQINIKSQIFPYYHFASYLHKKCYVIYLPLCRSIAILPLSNYHLLHNNINSYVIYNSKYTYIAASYTLNGKWISVKSHTHPSRFDGYPYSGHVHNGKNWSCPGSSPTPHHPTSPVFPKREVMLMRWTEPPPLDPDLRPVSDCWMSLR